MGEAWGKKLISITNRKMKKPVVNLDEINIMKHFIYLSFCIVL